MVSVSSMVNLLFTSAACFDPWRSSLCDICFESKQTSVEEHLSAAMVASFFLNSVAVGTLML